MSIRKLKNSDAEKLELFLSGHAETSMFLRSNMKRVGLEYQDNDFHGDYFGAFDENGDVTGVLAQYWNGNIMMQAPDRDVLIALINVFKEAVSRPIAGILGADDQASFLMDQLSLPDEGFAMNASDGLYALNLETLKLPDNFDFSNVQMVQATSEYKDVLKKWTKAYDIEALGAEDNEELNERIETEVQRILENSDHWILLADNKPVCMSGFNARLPDIVQIGPVWTPPQHRSRGYARALVAMTLQKAKEGGAEKAILFTANPAAAKAYEAIGF